MPGSLLSPPQLRVSRNESTRSDHSDCSNTSHSSAAGKKVSFNKAVRVKKYTRPKKSLSNGDLTATNGVSHSSNGIASGSPEKRFWFKVYKNKHRHLPDPKELRSNGVIYYDNDPTGHLARHVDDDVISYHPNPSTLNYPILTSESATQTPPKDLGPGTWLSNEYTPLHPSQMPTEPPHVRRDHVKKIVNRFNEEAVLSRQRSSDGEISPSGSPVLSPRYHSTPMKAHRIPTPPPEPPLLHYGTKQRSEVTTPPKSKKNPIVNGVKVIFGMTPLKKKGKADTKSHDKRDTFRVHSVDSSSDGRRLNGKSQVNGDYRSHVTASDGSDTEVKTTHRQIKSNGSNHGAIVSRPRGGLFRHEENENDNFDDYYFDNNDENTFQRRGKVHVETYDSGNQLVFDTTDVNTASTRLENGELFSTVGEKHQLWQNNKRIVVIEEPSPKIIRRKAKSHSDLLNNSDDEYKPKDRVDKGVSTEYLLSHKRGETNGTIKKTKDSGWLRLWRSTTKDKGVQCSKVPTSMYDEDIYAAGKYKVIKPRSAVASAYSDVPNIEKHYRQNQTEYPREDDHTSAISSSYQNGDIYSQVDKSKKRRDAKKKMTASYPESDGYSSNGLFKSRSEPLYIGPPPKEIRDMREEQHYGDYFFDEDGDRTIKTSKRSFGFRLSPGRENTFTKSSRKPVYREENWYDVDDDVEAVEKLKGKGSEHRDMSEIREEIANEEYASDFSSSADHKRNDVGAGSLMREFDYKKREISYENVPRSDGETNNINGNGSGANSGLWFRDADEDYRKEMAQSEVSYPAGSHVGSDRFYTVSRTDRASKQKPPPSPRAYTLDRRHMKDKKKTTPNSSGVKILVNGKEVHDGSKITTSKKSKGYHHRKSRHSEDPSSVQSDPLYVRGGLAAAYQARQRAAVRRSNSSVAGIGGEYRTSPVIRRRHRGTSEASSETESAHARRPLVMYIPGISHYEKSPEENDRSSGVNVARSQSMMTSTRPSKISSRSSKSNNKSGSRTELYRKPQIYEEDDEDMIMPLASDSNRKKPPKYPHDSRKSNNDIKRRHSMPKDTKFSWLKWKIRGKPSREP